MMRNLLTLILGLFSVMAAHCPEPQQSDGAGWSSLPPHLAALVMQRNIRSGHHVEMVPGAEGEVVLATWQRSQPDSPMEAWVASVDTLGSVKWRHSFGSSGRATSLDRSGEQIWVTGFAADQERANGESLMVIQILDVHGALLHTFRGPVGAVPMNIRFRSDGRVLVTGMVDRSIQWGNQALLAPDRERPGFITLLDAAGVPVWLHSTSEQVVVDQAQPLPGGGWLLSGQFIEALVFAGDTLARTESAYDQDGFVLWLNPRGEVQHIKVYGWPGHRKPGYRTRESVLDALVYWDGSAVVAALLDDPDQASDVLHLIHLDPMGRELSRTMVGRSDLTPGQCGPGPREGGHWSYYLTYCREVRHSGIQVDLADPVNGRRSWFSKNGLGMATSSSEPPML